ncbi:related to D-amino acid hydantoin hydrolase (hydantoinase) [Armillaria ostoyae]|uniref:Related to D-amino acid hydantoin hydrolase (Hydantoinase) n=1 Tax=Armillaria ostoyae TaxID=47428 RepID=A0A284RHA6_ARMOS|nr:related to D-amino acid hydantoin hydrolase (hydantoinase) [Armillaria ostoyae]
MYKIGVDVGGTNTDSVIVDLSKTHDPETRGIVASFKHATTVNVTDGIEAAVRKVLTDANIDPRGGKVLSLTIGTTHFINAVVQSDARRLQKVAIVRLAAPYTAEVPPFVDFPENLKKLMNGHYAIINGGLQMQVRDLQAEVVEQAIQIKAKGLKNVVVIGVFSPLDVSGSNEYKVRDILAKELGPAVNIICSRDVGQVGFLERENASILNASITAFAQHTIRGFERAMKRLGLTCPLYITQNDGTLTTAADAARLPIRTFSSGATNSMRGASYLAGIDLKSKEGTGKGMLVVDVGGTTTDVGMLLPSGFPRQAAAFIEVGGVRTNFSMPDISSIGLGGGSRVRAEDTKVTVGPDSVGLYLTRDAKVFGGDILTATDIAVRAGKKDIGDASLVSASVVDRMKTSPEDCTLLLVGGGSIIVPSALAGVKEIILPPFHSVANAVGAAIAIVSGEIDTIEILQGKSLPDTLERIKVEAMAKAVEAGADPQTTRIAEVNVLPVQYVTNQATRIIVKAIGELRTLEEGEVILPSKSEDGQVDVPEEDEVETAQEVLAEGAEVVEEIDYGYYRPTIVGNEWIVTETDLFFIMEGCGVLGTGGGGSPYPSYLIARQILRDGGCIRVVDHSSLSDEAYVVRGGMMGSPFVGDERLGDAKQILIAGKELAHHCGISEYAATLCDEIGGGNGMQSLILSHYYNVPALDGDLMGRAYPNLHQTIPSVYNLSNALTPCALHDGDGNVVIMSRAKDNHAVEAFMRTVTTEMGSSAALVPAPMTIAETRDYGVRRTLSQAWGIGRAIAMCRQKNDLKSVPDEILKLQNGKLLFIGKIVDVSREVRAGFTLGEVKIARLGEDELEDSSTSTLNMDHGPDDHMIIPFQNENLVAYIEKPDGARSVAAIVPDLISVLDSQSGSHLGTQMYSYGLRVTVIVMAGSPLWQSEKGLKSGGPAAFGFDHRYFPVGEYKTPLSVIEEYKR